ncbi:MAG: M50 family metallopeptidase [Anaerolineae bacterium]|nr:M50 family metallopeptidase [Anaerolineae bacterium]
MTAKERTRGAVLVSAAALGATFLLWQVEALSLLVVPFRLFVTLVHELGHGAAAALTGGQFIALEVMGNGAGLATTSGGTRFIVLQAGYLGAALFGGLLLVLANRLRDPRPLTALIGVLCGGTALVLGRDLGTRVIGLATGLVLFALARWGRPWLNTFALNLLAMMVALNAVLDIWGLVNSLDVTLSGVPNDAVAMQAHTGIPALFWGVLWIALSVGWLLLCAYWTYWRRDDGRAG